MGRSLKAAVDLVFWRGLKLRAIISLFEGFGFDFEWLEELFRVWTVNLFEGERLSRKGSLGG
jgi:hypothetical protein